MTAPDDDISLSAEERTALAEALTPKPLGLLEASKECERRIGRIQHRAPLDADIEHQILLRVWLDEPLTSEQTRALWAAYNFEKERIR